MRKFTIYLTWLVAYIAWVAAKHLNGASLAYIVIGCTNIVRHARQTWFSSYNGPLVALAAAASANGWPLLALATLASITAAMPVLSGGDRVFEKWAARWAPELTGIVRVMSIIVIIKALASGILGGDGVWTRIPVAVGSYLELAAVLLAAALSIALAVAVIAIFAVPLVHGVATVERAISR